LLTFSGFLYLFGYIGGGSYGRNHKILSYAISLLAFAHILLLWIPDKTVWHYLDTDMPHYMWAGVGALACLIVTIILALPKTRSYWHERHRHFSSWHYCLSLAIVVLSFWHIAGSGFYFSAVEAWVLAASCLFLLALHRAGIRVPPNLSPGAFVAVMLLPGFWLALRLF
tara:strand:- start:36 stop:542 length:507 start_codon:yes stop_codon:yes gene_type:complete